MLLFHPIVDEDRVQLTPPTQLVKEEGTKECSQVPSTPDSTPCQKSDENHRPSSQKKMHICSHSHKKIHIRLDGTQKPSKKAGISPRIPAKSSFSEQGWSELTLQSPHIVCIKCRLLGHSDDPTFKQVTGHSSSKSIYLTASEPHVLGSSRVNLQPRNIRTISDLTRLGVTSYAMSIQNEFCLLGPWGSRVTGSNFEGKFWVRGTVSNLVEGAGGQ